MVNRHVPHLLILPEDEATRSVASSFLDRTKLGAQIQVLREAGGWAEVLSKFLKQYQYEMVQYPHLHVVLLIDFDEDLPARFSHFVSQIPASLRERVFIFGAFDEIERAWQLGGLNRTTLGHALANECRENQPNQWCNTQLAHNSAECQRLLEKLPNFLF